MSRLNINRLTNENEDGSPKITGITTFSSNAFLEAPKGTTAQRPENVAPGMIRFNTDSGHLEYYTGEFWDEVLVANNTLDGGNRAVFASKFIGGPLFYTNLIEYVTISTLGNVQDFGDLTGNTADSAGMSSSTRGVFAGGYNNFEMNYITISSTGDAVSFGTLNNLQRICDGRASSSTRGIMFGSMLFSPFGSVNNSIEYITFSSTGNSVEFGDVYTNNTALGGGVQSSTRGVIGGTYNPATNVIQYVTISTTGNSQDFGDLTVNRNSCGGLSNSVRGIFGGGFLSPGDTNTIDFITISSLGNAQDFGDLISGARSTISGTSSSTRGLFSATTPGNAIEYITISTTGNTQDFGDLTLGGSRIGSLSNGHGGL